MAEKISVEIGLEGGAEVQRQLEDIGKSGQKAFGDIQGAAEQVNLTSATSEFQDLGNAGVDAFNQISQAAKSATIFESVLQGVKRVEGAFESLGTAATRIGARLTRALGPLGILARSFGPIGIAAGVAAGAFIKFGNDAAKAISGLTADAAKLDLTAQQFDKLRQALTQAGVAPESILPGLQKLKEVLGKDFFPTDLITGLQNFIARLERMPDSVERTKLAMDTLGDALGAQIITFLRLGGTADSFAAALSRVVPATEQQRIAAEKNQQALVLLSAAWAQFKAEIGTPITTPVFQFLTLEIQKLTAAGKELGALFQAIRAILAVFATPSEGQAAAAQRAAEAWRQFLAVQQQNEQQFNRTGQAAAQAGQTAAQAGQQGAQGFQVWNEELGKAVPAASAVGQAALQAGQAAAQSGVQGAQAGQQIAQGMNTAAQSAQEVNTSLQGIDWSGWASAALTAIGNIISKLVELLGLKERAGTSGGTGAERRARGGLIGGRGSGTSDSNLAWLSRGEYVIRAAAVRRFGAAFFAALNAGRLPGFQEGGLVGGGGTQTIRLKIQDIADAIKQNTEAINSQSTVIQELARILEEVTRDMTKGLSDLAGIATSLLVQQDHLEQAINAAIEQMRARGKARGGLIGGRGTGTSDSNLAWLSRGEYVINAAAVRRFGTALFATLNAGYLPGFALGGLMPRQAFATGAAVGSMSNVTINFPGLPAISGLRASSAVVGELQKAATLAQVRSGGRKPSRYS